MLSANLTKTNAFEIFFNGQLVFSKLAQGRMPVLQEVIGPIEAAFTAAKDSMQAAGVVL